MNFVQEFRWRGLVHDTTEALEEAAGKEKLTAYIGFDPTAASLHVGSLLPIMCLARLQRMGHSPIGIVGGGTGLIGDPSGKTQERQLLTLEQTEANLQGIKAQLNRFLDFEVKTNPARIINNAEWLVSIKAIDFLRDIGKYFTVNYMLAKESVKKRMEQEEGISFTEFSYMLLQSYDYLEMYDRCKCTLQMGGSDQWGNITAGIELIRRLRGVKAHGLVFPLVTSSSGVKFGKTESGAVWLDAELTSPYRYYQFWLNATDADAITFLKYFTWLTETEIAELTESHQAAPEKRLAQYKLAELVTALTHGPTALARAQKASQALFGQELADLSSSEIKDIFGDVPRNQLPKTDFEGDGVSAIDLFVTTALCSSKSEARRLLENGGAYVNNLRQSDVKARVGLAQTIDGHFFVLRKGQKQYHLVEVVDI